MGHRLEGGEKSLLPQQKGVKCGASLSISVGEEGCSLQVEAGGSLRDLRAGLSLAFQWSHMQKYYEALYYAQSISLCPNPQTLNDVLFIST